MFSVATLREEKCMNNRLIAAITGTVVLAVSAALFAPAAYGGFHDYASFKGKKQGQLKAETKKVNSKSKNSSTTGPSKSTKGGAPNKLKLANPQGNLPPHPP
jgi:hypothetical protein